MVLYSNLCLSDAPVASYQIARSTSLLFSLCLGRLLPAGLGLVSTVLYGAEGQGKILGLDKTRDLLSQCGDRLTVLRGASCMLVAAGFLFASFDPETLTFRAACEGALASLFGCLYMFGVRCLLKSYQQTDRSSPSKATTVDSTVTQAQLILHVAGNSMVLCLPFVAFEFNECFWHVLVLVKYAQQGGCVTLSDVTIHIFVVLSLLAAAGVLATLVPLTTFSALGQVSPLTCNVVGFMKSCLQTFGGVILFGDQLTFNGAWGIVICLSGCFLYGLQS
eukprot:GHVQ01018047.1.p1 GENE.GHVQ01018047.1~~GHVQ01018047.1.p1  ORF type:complete len:277 (-),score=17.58 GHVQ01018047.1:96-926(-)